MAREEIFLGTISGDGTGSSLKAGGQNINNNFIELYNKVNGLLTTNIISTNTTAVIGNLYVMTASLTLTLPATPTIGDKVGISNRSDVLTSVIARNGELIMGLAEDLTLDKLNAGFEMVYTGATKGWIII